MAFHVQDKIVIELWNTNAGEASFVWVQVPTIPADGSSGAMHILNCTVADNFGVGIQVAGGTVSMIR